MLADGRTVTEKSPLLAPSRLILLPVSVIAAVPVLLIVYVLLTVWVVSSVPKSVPLTDAVAVVPEAIVLLSVPWMVIADALRAVPPILNVNAGVFGSSLAIVTIAVLAATV